MVAGHTAAQRVIKHGGCALAGGVNLMLAETTTAAAYAASMLSAAGRCKTLDAAADGYVRAEACIVLRLDTRPGAAHAAEALFLAGTAVNQVPPPFSFLILESP